jgi:hypothetical protein
MPHAGLIRFGPPRAPAHPGLPAVAARALLVPNTAGPLRGSRIAPPERSDRGMAMRAATVAGRFAHLVKEDSTSISRWGSRWRQLPIGRRSIGMVSPQSLLQIQVGCAGREAATIILAGGCPICRAAGRRRRQQPALFALGEDHWSHRGALSRAEPVHRAGAETLRRRECRPWVSARMLCVICTSGLG